jgi:hypothetical protein
VLVLGLLFTPLVHAASETTPPGGDVDQVTVEATRDNVVKLEKQVKMTELKFYELYNTLNKNRDYAIDCEDTPATGTRFKRSSCQPMFKTKAEQEEARQFLIAFGAGDQVTGTPDGVSGPLHINAPPPPPAASAGAMSSSVGPTSAGRPGFKQNMIDITNKSPELQKLAKEHAELWKRYYRLYRQLNGAGPPSE